MIVTPNTGFCNCSIFSYFTFLFCDHLDGEERELAALLSSSDCCVAFPLSAMGLSAVCDCDTHLLLLGVNHANSDGFGESAHLLGLV